MNNAQGIFYLSPEEEVSAEKPKKTGSTLNSDTASGSLESHLGDLAQLVANVTESYTVSVFLADNRNSSLRPVGFHTLSRDFISTAKISYGCGLVGWTAENKVRISVCPFQHDATTLLYYRRDQDLKSFIAVPILRENSAKGGSEELLGVISCDSKKSYAYAKVTEKILLDCAKHAAALIDLHQRAKSSPSVIQASTVDPLEDFLLKLRKTDSEDSLLSLASHVPNSLISRDALVVITTAEGGVGAGAYYSSKPESSVEHRLLDILCRNKKVLCSHRSVHALPMDDHNQRSFLSIPFQVLGREAGAFNLLSRPHEAFRAEDISVLEKIAREISRELERIRLRDKFSSSMESTDLLSWKHFSIQAKLALIEARKKNINLSLVRISLENLKEIENHVGVDGTTGLAARLMRLVDQVKRQNSLSCYLYGFQLLILCESQDAEQMLGRLKRLIERMSKDDLSVGESSLPVNVGKMVLSGMKLSTVDFPQEADSLNELVSTSLRKLSMSTKKESRTEAAVAREVRVNARSW